MLQSKVRGRYYSSVCVQERTCIRAGFLSICLDAKRCECVCVHASKRVCIVYHPRNVFSPLSICIYLQLLSEVATQEVKPTARFTLKPVRRTNCVSQSVPTCSARHRQSWERDIRQTLHRNESGFERLLRKSSGS